MIYLLRQHKDEQIMIDKLLVLCRELKEGNFDNRIIYVKTKSKKLAEIADNLNNTIDGLEAYLRKLILLLVLKKVNFIARLCLKV